MKDYEILDRLACYHDTDKSSKWHHYTKHYADHLPDSCGKLLEIGAYKGSSLRLWKDIYSCEIHTIDIFKEFRGKYLGILQKEGIICHQGDQANIKFLKTIKDKFDIIIDDGSHNSRDMNVSFDYLFNNSLNPGGLYVVEDLHCCTEHFYRGGMNFEETMLYRLGQEIDWNDQIDKVILCDEKIAFIFKK